MNRIGQATAVLATALGALAASSVPSAEPTQQIARSFEQAAASSQQPVDRSAQQQRGSSQHGPRLRYRAALGGSPRRWPGAGGHTVKQGQRAACKARNVRRNRRAHR